MVKRLPAWFFLAIALLLMGMALLPVIRVVMGIEQQMALQFMTVVMFLVGGLMSGLTAMLLLVRREPKIDWSTQAMPKTSNASPNTPLRMHACGLLLFSGIPLLNFLSCYWLWLNHRRNSEVLDQIGQEVLNFQITIYLYLLLSLFMVVAGIGILTTPLLLIFHLLVTVLAIVSVARGKQFWYPANIPIIQGRPVKQAVIKEALNKPK